MEKGKIEWAIIRVVVETADKEDQHTFDGLSPVGDRLVLNDRDREISLSRATFTVHCIAM